jgi:hypothetical protein
MKLWKLKWWWREWGGLLAFLLGVGCVMFSLLFFSVRYSAQSCARVCEHNGDESEYLWTGGGCWCLDEQGAYNPKDSREDRRR